MDEVLAVEMPSFQANALEKCRMLQVVVGQLLFVSHNMAAVENLCSRAYLLPVRHCFPRVSNRAGHQSIFSKPEIRKVIIFERSNDRKGSGLLSLRMLDFSTWWRKKSSKSHRVNI